MLGRLMLALGVSVATGLAFDFGQIGEIDAIIPQPSAKACSLAAKAATLLTSKATVADVKTAALFLCLGFRASASKATADYYCNQTLSAAQAVVKGQYQPITPVRFWNYYTVRILNMQAYCRPEPEVCQISANINQTLSDPTPTIDDLTYAANLVCQGFRAAGFWPNYAKCKYAASLPRRVQASLDPLAMSHAVTALLGYSGQMSVVQRCAFLPPTTLATSTAAPSTEAPTTKAPKPTKPPVTTSAPATQAPTTKAPKTTLPPKPTKAPTTTPPPPTEAPTTKAPKTTKAPTMAPKTTKTPKTTVAAPTTTKAPLASSTAATVIPAPGACELVKMVKQTLKQKPLTSTVIRTAAAELCIGFEESTSTLVSDVICDYVYGVVHAVEKSGVKMPVKVAKFILSVKNLALYVAAHCYRH